MLEYGGNADQGGGVLHICKLANERNIMLSIKEEDYSTYQQSTKRGSYYSNVSISQRLEVEKISLEKKNKYRIEYLNFVIFFFLSFFSAAITV